MPVEFVSKPLEGHPLTELQYEWITNDLDVGGQTLKLTTLANVERSIDQVFSWLEQKGRETAEIERLAPYFGVVWPSALALTGYLLKDKFYRTLAGRNVLELGCGLAIPSMVAAKLGSQVICMDHHPDVPRFLNQNVQQNEPCQLTFIASDERSLVNRPVKYHRYFDLILASDILYESHLAPHFAQEIDRFATDHSTVLIADPGRPYIQSFVNHMKELGWVDELQPWTVHYQGKAHDIFLMIFKRS